MADVTRRRFGLLATAAALNAKSLLAQQQVPAADPDLQDAIQAGLDAAKNNAEEVGRDLYAIADTLFERMPATLPEVKQLPPKPKVYLYDGNQISVSNIFLNLPEGQADALTISRKAKAGCSPEELTYAMAHELAHILIALNKDMEKAYKVPNTRAVRKDLHHLGITADDSDKNFERYKDELLADRIAIRLTRDLAAFVSYRSKAAQSLLRSAEHEADPKTEEKIAAREQQDHKVSPRERKKMIAAGRVEYILNLDRKNPHPTDEIRIKAAYEVAEELKKQERGERAPGHPDR